jgi:excisionase family DNA binding protein
MSSDTKPAISSADAQGRAQPGVSRIALTIDEAAEALGVSRRTIEHEIMKGNIRPRAFGRYQLISVDALKKLFQ